MTKPPVAVEFFFEMQIKLFARMSQSNLFGHLLLPLVQINCHVMKTALLLVLPFSLFLFQFSPASAQDRGMQQVILNIDGQTTTLYRQSYALVIGVSRYTNGLKSLPGVSEDIPEVKNALENNGFEVTVVMNPDATTMKQAYTDFIARYGQGSDNRLLFYFAGHGYTERMPYGGDIGYICPSDAPSPNTSPAAFAGNAIPMAEVEIFAKRIRSNHAMFIFDACFAGQIFTPNNRAIPAIISYKTHDPVRMFITSGTAEEEVPDNSIFRPQFTQALKGDADANHDGFITGTELGEYLQTTVVNYSNNAQHPQYGKIRDPKLDKGDFVFTVNQPLSKPPVIVNERALELYGQLELTTEISGMLYIDGEKVREVNANTVLTLNVSAGTRKIEIMGEETVEKEVAITANETANLTMKKRPRESLSRDLEMVFVQGGTFEMGSNDGYSNEKPVHSVTLDDFSIGKTEVTQTQWREVMGSDPPGLDNKGCDQCPVEGVTWDDVQNFITKLDQKTGKTYRLPTEAEWEYAAKGGNESRGYPYSGSSNLDDVAWNNQNSGNKTHPVGQKQPNELGLYDMSGNVWEWCGDWYGPGYYQGNPVSNPKGPSSGSIRVNRGGSWYDYPEICHTTIRNYYTPDNRRNFLGFRLVLDQ